MYACIAMEKEREGGKRKGMKETKVVKLEPQFMYCFLTLSFRLKFYLEYFPILYEFS